MDKRELEMLMDKYKKEMMEFSRRNGGYTDSAPLNEREEQQQRAEDDGVAYERDRSDPLAQADAEINAETDAVAAQTTPQPREDNSGSSPNPVYGNETVDVPAYLRSLCANPSEEQRQRCNDIQRFLTQNPETGTMQIETSAAGRAFAVNSARVMIFLPLDSGNITLFDGLTDISGLTDKIILPAPARNLSTSPNNGNALPYAVYTVYVEHPSFVRSIFNNVPVFSGVESIQPVEMLAKVEGLNEPEPIIVNETSFGAL